MIKDGGGTWPSHLSNPPEREASQCELCQKESSQIGKLTLHINAVQPKRWWYLASLPSSLLQMIKDGGGTWPSHLSNPPEIEASQCELCQKESSQIGKLTLHINVVQLRRWWCLAFLPSSLLQ